MKEYFICENCGTRYDTREEAVACELSVHRYETGKYYTQPYMRVLRFSMDGQSLKNIKEHDIAKGVKPQKPNRYYMANWLCNGSNDKLAKASDYDELEKDLQKRLKAVRKVKEMLIKAGQI